MSMLTETLSLVISGDGKMLGNELGKQERRVNTFAGKVGGMFAGMGKRISGAVGKLSNPLALIGGTAGVMMAARNLIDYQDSLTSLGISAGMSAGQLMELERSTTSLAYSTGQSRENLVAAAKEMAGLTGDNDFAAAALEDVGKAATTMGTDITATAQAFAAFRRDLGASNGQAAELFNTMAAMGNTQSMDGFAKSARALGLTMDNFAGYSALVKAFGDDMGGVDNAAAAIDKIAIAIKGGDRRVKRAFGGVIDDKGTITDYKKLLDTLSKMTERERKKALGGIGKELVEFDAGKVTADFDKYIEKGKNAAFITENFAKKQQGAKFQMNMLSTAAKEFAGVALSPVLADLTAQMNALTGNPEAMEKFRSNLQGIADTIGALGQVVGVVGKALGAWGDMWEWIGDKSGKTEVMIAKAQSSIYNAGAPLRRKLGLEDADGNVAGVAKVFNEGLSSATRLNRSPNAVPEKLNAMGLQQKNPPTTVNVEPPEVKNNIVINQQITPDGRVITDVNDPNTAVKTNSNTGRFDK